MTREEAKKAAEVMLAYAEGKNVEIKDKKDTNWRSCRIPDFDWEYFDFRVKPSPKYRPFESAEECWNEMQKHQPFGWVKEGTVFCNLSMINVYDIGVVAGTDINFYDFSDMLKDYIFADGTPFGVKEGGEE